LTVHLVLGTIEASRREIPRRAVEKFAVFLDRCRSDWPASWPVHNLARARRLLSLRPAAGRGEVHAHRQRCEVRSHRRGPGGGLSRGSWRRARSDSSIVLARAFCRSAPTARRSKKERPLRRFGT